MASQLLIEGALDAKDPRGSEDRKFWKAWQRQWAKFSVVYPSGRREPYMVLTLSRSSSEAPEREIKLSRDGLRLFRCRSKSRPCRTWAITSGNKVILYFAAGSEIQAQNWMQAVRDGLWPPCFSFQMLTACSYEVSLVDDDNTFMAGHLGVYGRFVLTSENVISLMHPHWGSTSLEISLDNIIDVLFIREAEISPAGVFSIILKRVEGSNVKALQFFCNTAKDAMQWILSNLYARRKSFSLNERKSPNENRVSFSISDNSISSETNLYENLDNEKTFSIDSQLVSSQTNSSNITGSIIETNFQSEFENIQFSHTNSFKNEEKYSSFDKDKEINKITGNSLEKTSDNNVDENRLLDLSSNENIYENIINGTTPAELESFKTFGTNDNLSPEYAHKKYSSKKDLVASNLSITQVRDESVLYAVVNKSHCKNSEELSVNNESMHDEYASGSSDLDKYKPFSFLENFKSRTSNSSLSKNTTTNIFTFDTKTEKNKTKESQSAITLNYDSKFLESNISNGHSYGSDNKNSLNDLSIQAKATQCSSINDFLNDHGSSAKNNRYYLPSLPSSFLDTSLNTLNPKNKSRGSSSSSEEDTENLLSLVNEFDQLKMNDQIYADILERKGTIYEEIDESEDDSVCPSLNVPELPRRPTNLEIPESLRLQKLSRNIKHTLEVMEDIQSQKELRRPSFIKKIKDVNRIMRLSPTQEYANESFKVESKLKMDTKSEPVLTPNAPKTCT